MSVTLNVTALKTRESTSDPWQSSVVKSDAVLDANNITYDSTETYDAGSVGEELNSQKNTLNSKILKAASAITPQTTQQTYTLTGLTANHELIRWNFKNSGTDVAENLPPCDLTWSTGANQWTLIAGSATSVTCQPVFAIAE